MIQLKIWFAMLLSFGTVMVVLRIRVRERKPVLVTVVVMGYTGHVCLLISIIDADFLLLRHY